MVIRSHLPREILALWNVLSEFHRASIAGILIRWRTGLFHWCFTGQAWGNIATRNPGPTAIVHQGILAPWTGT